MFKVEVAFATADKQTILSLEVMPHTTVATVIALSGILSCFPEINLTDNKVGIFGKVVELSTPVTPGDRIEIYKPLIIDPKQARRLRAGRK